MSILVIADFRKVQSFIFESTHLKYIRGASRWVCTLNREILHRHVREPHGKTLVRDGGVLMAEFASQDLADAFAADVRVECGPHIGITVASHEWKEPDDFPTARTALLEKLEVKKQIAENVVALCTNSYVMRCEECGFRPATAKVASEEPYICVCATCKLKLKFSERGWCGLVPARDLSQLGEAAKPPNYIATVLIL